MTAVEMLGRVDELTDGRFGSVDAATEGGDRSILEIPAKTRKRLHLESQLRCASSSGTTTTQPLYQGARVSEGLGAPPPGLSALSLGERSQHKGRRARLRPGRRRRVGRDLT